MKIFLLALIISMTFFLNFSAVAFAQTTNFDVVSTYKVTDTQALDGDILVTNDNLIERANVGYTDRLFGVLQSNPLVVYKNIDNEGQPVSRAGIATVNVTTFAGEIKTGDYITSSEISGKGQKANKSGYVIGVALANFGNNQGETTSFANKQVRVGKIPVALRIEFAEINSARTLTRLLDYLNEILFQNLQNPEKFVQIVRYAAAGLIVLVGFIVSFLTFSKSVSKGVEAIGRNPLARNAIQFSIILNTVLTLIIALVSLVAAFIILRF